MPQHRYANPALGLLALRVGLGLIMVVNGAQKLFGIFGGGGLDGTAQFFASHGIPVPAVTASFVGTVEFIGGIAIIAGAWTHIAAILIAVVMAAATIIVHLPNGFTGEGGYAFTFILFLAAIALFFVGPGQYSVDRRLHVGREARVATEPGGG